MRRAGAAGLVAVGVLLAACGGGDKAVLDQADAAASSSGGGGATTTGGGGSARSSATTAPAKGTPTTTAGGGSAPAASSGSRTNDTVPDANFKLTVTVSQRCTRPGGVQVVTVKGKAQGIVTYVVAYADGRTHSNSNGGLVDGKGVFRDQFVVSPEAPPGVARLTANEASKHDGLGFGRVEFTVGAC